MRWGEVGMDERLLRHDVIVFDVGNVLVSFDRRRIADGFGLDEALYHAVFDSGIWLWMDTGLMTVGAVADLMCRAAHRDSLEDYLKVCRLLENFPDYEQLCSGSLLLPQLKQSGKRLYYLTNYGTPMFERTQARFPFFQLFDGGVVSAREHVIKPMPRIYELLCERYGFQPEDALFVDDHPENVRAAQQLGFDVWHFQGTPIEG